MLGVAVDVLGLVVAGDGDDAEVRQRKHGTLCSRSSSKYAYGSSTSEGSLKKSMVVQSLKSLPLPVGSLPAAGAVPRPIAVQSLSDAGQLLSIRPRTWQGVGVASSPPTRRIGAEDSKTRAQLLDAAEALLLDEGYAAVTSRKVAASAGLKPQLVHYYFRTMDDLYVEVFRRAADRNLAHFEDAIAADGSLTNLWRLNADRRGAAFSVEFVALAKHRPAIRTEIARYAERFRAAQIEALSVALAERGVPDEQMPPIAALLLMTGLAQVLALEEVLGVRAGHEETVAFIEQAIARLDRGAGESSSG